jgi:cyclic beta-1,2-glucan synthetase
VRAPVSRAYQASLAVKNFAQSRQKGQLDTVDLSRFRTTSNASPWDTEDSIREELFSIERLEEHAESLAAAQPILARPMPRRSLAVRLRDNEAVLLEAYRVIGSASEEGRDAGRRVAAQ